MADAARQRSAASRRLNLQKPDAEASMATTGSGSGGSSAQEELASGAADDTEASTQAAEDGGGYETDDQEGAAAAAAAAAAEQQQRQQLDRRDAQAVAGTDDAAEALVAGAGSDGYTPSELERALKGCDSLACITTAHKQVGRLPAGTRGLPPARLGRAPCTALSLCR